MRDIRLGMNPELISHKGKRGGGVIIHTSTGVIFVKIQIFISLKNIYLVLVINVFQKMQDREYIQPVN